MQQDKESIDPWRSNVDRVQLLGLFRLLLLRVINQSP
jgi:hypothetical protein